MRSIDFPELSRRIPLAVVLQLIAWEPFRRERVGMRGYCPIHSLFPHRSRSFSASYKGKWFCHVCNVGGDGLELFRLMVKLPRYEAALALAKAAMVEVPYLKRQRANRKPRNREGAT